jgi:hypothetical protein
MFFKVLGELRARRIPDCVHGRDGFAAINIFQLTSSNTCEAFLGDFLVSVWSGVDLAYQLELDVVPPWPISAFY